MVKAEKPKIKCIKNFDEDTWKAARVAALKEGKTLGKWLTEAARVKLLSKKTP